ncbi:CDPK-related kinase 5 [Porphyridium purpureum]|uniref:CDPK-related kinase 5 n=1 Tax=Porphyridium purpureum TaxID=35688 RepID=A0A5J4Z4N5_PORPP|nr:CDPK-related kinase 5 [Porphyridium purpureum]|eukprot:POR3564..scf295_1
MVVFGEYYDSDDEFERRAQAGALAGTAVHLANAKDERSVVAAVKVVEKRRALADQRNLRMLRSEVACLARVHEFGPHPNIMRVYEITEDVSNIYIVSEYLDGGELFSLLAHAESVFVEAECAALMYHLLHAVSFLHSVGIHHRDIKPENLMFSKGAGVAGVKLIDFGVSFLVEEANLMNRINIGSALYLPPENIYGEPYTYKADIWSVGIIAFICLTGSLPYDLTMSENLLDVVLEFGPSFDLKDFKSLPADAQNFVRQMLSTDKEQRPNAEQLLSHPWLQKFITSSAAKKESNKVYTDRARTGIEPLVTLLSLESSNARRDLRSMLIQERITNIAQLPGNQLLLTGEGSDHLSVHGGSSFAPTPSRSPVPHQGNGSLSTSSITGGEESESPGQSGHAISASRKSNNLRSTVIEPPSSALERRTSRDPRTFVRAEGPSTSADASPLVRKFGYGTALWSSKNLVRSNFHIPSLLDESKVTTLRNSSLGAE